MMSDDRIVDLFKTLADPNRLQLFTLLMHSDYANSELMGLTGISQNLLSHHLSVLTESGLIKVHQSAGDARRRYYMCNLEVTRAVSRWWLQHSPPSRQEDIPGLARPQRMLFLCLRNAARSLIPEVIANQLASDALIATSAGITKNGDVLPPMALHVLQENGLTTEGLAIKSVEDVAQVRYDYVVTVCDLVHEYVTPEQFPGAQFVHWSLRDPVEMGGTHDEILLATRELYRTIYARIAFFVQQLAEEERQARLP